MQHAPARACDGPPLSKTCLSKTYPQFSRMFIKYVLKLQGLSVFSEKYVSFFKMCFKDIGLEPNMSKNTKKSQILEFHENNSL